MALTVVDNRIILNEADSTSGWTATDGPTLFTSAPSPIESTGLLGMNVSNTNENAYISITSDDYSGGGSLSVWIVDRASLDTTANGGVGIVVGDGTNRIAYYVGGSDGTAFRHDTGPVKFACFLLDLANKPANFTALAGSEASLNEAAITQVGVRFVTIAKSVGGVENCFWDIIRFADNGVGIEVYGGTVGTPENISTLATADRGTGNQQAYGIIRELATGVYGVQGNISLGDNTSTNNTYINIDGDVIAFENRSLSSNNYYRFNVAGNGTGTTDINIDNAVLTVSTGGSCGMDFSDANSTVDARSTVFSGVDQGITTGDNTTDWFGNTFLDCGTVETPGADMINCTYSGFVGVADDSQLFWNTTTDPDGLLDGSSFTKGSAATHAIEFPTGMTSKSITLRNIDFSGYNASNSQNDSTLNVLATTGTLTVNVVGGSGNVSYKSAGATVNIVLNPVSTIVTVNDNTASPLSGARVYLAVTSGAGGYPYKETVTITRSGSTATVSHTAHGLSTNHWVFIEGADQQEYNGVKQVTVTGANAYTFTVSGTPTTPATGNLVTNAQDETSYDNSPTTEGTFSGGTGHAASDVITITGGTQITVDAVSGGVVTQFTVDSTMDNVGGHAATDVLSQVSTTGSGTGFSLTLDTDNLSIRSTAVIIHGTTNVSGQISDSRTFSANQPVSGWARSATTSPYFKQAPLSGTINSSNGASFTVQLILDE